MRPWFRYFIEHALREAPRQHLAAITQKCVGDSSSIIPNAKKTARTTGFSPRIYGVVDGAAYTRLEPDDECDEANLAAVLLHPWKASSGGNRGRCREGVTHGFLLLPWGNRNGGIVGVVLGRRLETLGAIWELRVEQSWGAAAGFPWKEWGRHGKESRGVELLGAGHGAGACPEDARHGRSRELAGRNGDR
jgi:hypothetical protein